MRTATCLLWLLLSLVACGVDPASPTEPTPAPSPVAEAVATGEGPDRELAEWCLICHDDHDSAWSDEPSSHALTLSCVDCHDAVIETRGPGHGGRHGCDACHSEVSHPASSDCTDCHNPHGSTNEGLIRPIIPLPDGGQADVLLGAPEGRSALGLAREATADGSGPGTGLCEVCHDTTAYYNQQGSGSPHEAEWCLGCHLHEVGFR